MFRHQAMHCLRMSMPSGMRIQIHESAVFTTHEDGQREKTREYRVTLYCEGYCRSVSAADMDTVVRLAQESFEQERPSLERWRRIRAGEKEPPVPRGFGKKCKNEPPAVVRGASPGDRGVGETETP